MSTEVHLPDLEALSAYLDGRLSGEAKARVEERLARDEEYYEVFLAASESMEEEELRGGGKVLRPTAWRRFGPLAAAAMIFLSVGLWRMGPGADYPSYLPAGEIVAVVAWSDLELPGATRQGAGDRLDDAQRFFQLGIRLLELEVAQLGGDEEALEEVFEEVAQLAQNGGIGFLVEGYESILKADAASRGLEIERIRDSFRKLAGDHERRFDLGRWWEAARLCALQGDAEALHKVARKAPSTEDPDVLALRDVAAGDQVDWSRVEAILEKIKDAYAG